MVRQRMEGIRDADEVVRLVADLGGHHEGRHAREVALECQRDEIEHQLQVLIEIARNAGRRVRQVDLRRVTPRKLLHAPLDLAHRLEVVPEHRLVARAEAALQIRRIPVHQIQHAAVFAREQLALVRRIALSEQLLEQLAGIVLHRQRRRRCPERNRLAVAAAVVAVTRPLAATLFRPDFQRRQWRVHADVFRRDLVRGDAGASGARICGRSKSAPVFVGVHLSITAPCGK